MSVDCTGCNALCCHLAVIPLTALDIWRITKRSGEGLSGLIRIERSQPEPTTVLFERDGGEYDWFVRCHESGDESRCVFLRPDPGGVLRCALYPDLPRSCAVYPMRWFGSQAVVGPARFCPAERVDRARPVSDDDRLLLLQRRQEWYFQCHLAAMWNRAVASGGPGRWPPPAMLGWMLDCAEIFVAVSARYPARILEAWAPAPDPGVGSWSAPQRLASGRAGEDAGRFVLEVLDAMRGPEA